MNKQTAIEASGPHVYQAIAEVQGELAKTGIAKNRKNQQGSGYMFRGIDDVYAALSPLLSAHKLVVVPRVLTREVIDRQSKSGGALFYVTVHAEFDFISAIDGTTHTAATFGEAMDSGDKATNKAMSAAYKYAAFMTFAIPTEGDNDSENSTHEVAVVSGVEPRGEPRVAEITAKEQDGDLSPSALKGALRTVVHNINGCGDMGELLAYLAIPECKSALEQCERRAPAWWSTGEGMPPEFVPLQILIANKTRELGELEDINRFRSTVDAG